MAETRNPGDPTLAGLDRHLPAPLIDRLRTCLGSSHLVGRRALDAVPASGGAYALLLHLEHEVAVATPMLEAEPIAPGWYLYAGSAMGPGGLRARLLRHFRTDKTSHWHVDRLTAVCAPAAALSIAGGNECAIVADLTASGAFDFALTGFGSSDCRQCRSHLLAWRE